MPRGKSGPKPVRIEELPEEPSEQQTEEAAEKTAEEIVGADNVVDVGAAREGIAEYAASELIPQGYQCSEPGCTFSSPSLTEAQEHVNGTGHGGWDVEEKPKPEQPQLFAEKGIVQRVLDSPLDEDFLNVKRKELSNCYLKKLDIEADKKSAVDGYNAKIKTQETRMEEIARILTTPFEQKAVDCEWKIMTDENCRKLIRLDTGAVVEVKPLTAEDRAAELQQAQAANAASEQVKETAAAEEPVPTEFPPVEPEPEVVPTETAEATA